MNFLTNKNILITGVASNRSIAYGIAKAMHAQGANLCFTYYGERFKERVEKLALEFDSSIVLPCDVGDDRQITQTFDIVKDKWQKLDGLVHSVAYAPKEELEGDYLENSSREGFKIAHEASSYSLTALAKEAKKLFIDGGSIITLSYLGSQRAVKNYNVMGLAKASLEANVRYLAQSLGKNNIRVNAISAGPIKTLAAAGIKDFKKILSHNAQKVPLKRNITTEEVGNVAAFLCSELSSAITGEVINVDNGYHAIDPLAAEETEK